MQGNFLRSLGQIVRYLLLGLVLFYIVDWGQFEVRLRRGSGMGSISVEQYLRTPLKGQKLEFDYLGAADQNCARAMFPQYVASQWVPPCWWLQRHRQKWQ
jgi:hypothetical protein